MSTLKISGIHKQRKVPLHMSCRCFLYWGCCVMIILFVFLLFIPIIVIIDRMDQVNNGLIFLIVVIATFTECAF